MGQASCPLAGSGKLGALHEFVTVEPETSATSSHPVPLGVREQRVQESHAFVSLRTRVADTLRIQAQGIAERWETRVQSVALQASGGSDTSGHSSVAVALVESLATALASGGATAEDMVALGLAFGAEAFERGTSLHHTLKGLDLLTAIGLYAVETAVLDEPIGELTLADGVLLCRRFQQGSSLIALAAVKGYSQAADSVMRDRFRHLRHDLRNPLGTIKSVLALMDDETIPADERSNPRFRAMAKRNARSLGELIGERLSDAEAMLPAHLVQAVSLRTIVCTVRRDLRAEASARNTVILIAGTKIRVQVDAVGLELMLHELLVAALQESIEGDELNIGFDETASDRATIFVRRTPDRPLISQDVALERINTLAIQMGAKLVVALHLVLTFPARCEDAIAPPLEVSAQLPVDSDVDVTARSGHGNVRHDVRGTREREHGQPSSF
jgi:signal transduction histidine kinase